MTKIERRYGGKPDFEHFRRVVMRETDEGPIPQFEGLIDPELQQLIMGRSFPVPRHVLAGDPPKPKDLGSIVKLADLLADFYFAMGHDYVCVPALTPLLQAPQIKMQDTAEIGSIRGWQNEHTGVIASIEDFEKFPWPPVGGNPLDKMPIQYVAKKMAEGMKVVLFVMGPMEYLRGIMSYETLAYSLIDQPDLVEAVSSRIGDALVTVVEHCIVLDEVGGIYYGDDLAHTNGLMISPDHLRKYILPTQKKIADLAHENDKFHIFHTCGDNRAMIREYIEDIGIDALHSFQDNIYPPEEIKEKYGDRLAIMGGLDVDLLTRGPENKIRARARELLEVCSRGGGYCFGSANSVPDYVPMDNYLAAIDEWAKFNESMKS